MELRTIVICVTLMLTLINATIAQDNPTCDSGQFGFELITGFVYSSPGELIATVPGTLELSDCLSQCLNSSSCQSINFETGLCILFSSSALQRPSALSASQFPVFTIYAQKRCFSQQVHNVCTDRAWIFESVTGYQLSNYGRKTEVVNSKMDCVDKCVLETEFDCRSANFNNQTKECSLSEMDRHTIASTSNYDQHFRPSTGTQNLEYLENNCIREPTKLCDFKPVKGRVLKTVDSVHQDVKTIEECRKRCLEAKYRCFSFDLGDVSSQVCRTSHLDTASLTHINEAYFEVPDAVTYELSSCYNVTIICRSREMVAKIKTNRIFNGKVYSKTKPNSCMNDVTNSLEFQISMGYSDVNCDVQQANNSKYLNDIVIQHHDLIVTTRDLGLSVICSYDLTNRTIVNTVYFEPGNDGTRIPDDERFIHSSTVSSPNISIAITDKIGTGLQNAQVGDPITLRFEISDDESPYELFIRQLVAIDGSDSNEIELIDKNGCPTDIAIMGPIKKTKGGNGKHLETTFEAFKFPTSDVVQFRAVVSPCLGACQPVHCFSEGFDGTKQESYSFGKRRRKRSASLVSTDNVETNGSGKVNNKEDNDVVVMQSITITDGFDFEESSLKSDEKGKGNGNEYNVRRQLVPSSSSASANDDSKSSNNDEDGLVYGLTTFESSCLNLNSVLLVCGLMFTAQIGILLLWTYLRYLQSAQSKKRLASVIGETATLKPTSVTLSTKSVSTKSRSTADVCNSSSGDQHHHNHQHHNHNNNHQQQHHFGRQFRSDSFGFTTNPSQTLGTFYSIQSAKHD